MFTLAIGLLSFRPLQRAPFAFGWLTRQGLPRPIADHYLHQFRRTDSTRRDLIRFLTGVNNRPTRRLAGQLGDITIPVLVAWSVDDRVFPYEHAERLTAAIPQATLTSCAGAYAYLPFDQPEWLADSIVSFHQGLIDLA